jgi:pyridoxamine 5'-phosphate oxidase
MEWLTILRQAIGMESEPLVATLATVDTQNSPAARSVIIRKVADDGSLWLTSHARSQKNREVRMHPLAAMVFWFPKTREQFRISGSVKVLNAGNHPEVLEEVWATLPEATRATFYWPQPDAPRSKDAQAFPAAPPANEPQPPETFEVLVLHPRIVDRLDLRPHPHDRRQWMQDIDTKVWWTEPLNP